MSGFRNYVDDEGDISRTFGNTSKAILGDSSYRKKEPIKTPTNAMSKPDSVLPESKGLTFAQAASTVSNSTCPCCNQMLPNDRRNINYNYDKSWKVVASNSINGNLAVDNSRMNALSPSTGNFPMNDYQEPTSPNPASRNSHNTEESKNSKNKRKRKTKGQVKKLEDEFSKNPHWTNDDVDKISRDIKLDRSQVYKWNWDQKKKLNILPSKVYVVTMPENMSHVGTTHVLNDNKTKVVYLKSPNDLHNLKNTK
jgi:hypothetical protein